MGCGSTKNMREGPSNSTRSSTTVFAANLSNDDTIRSTIQPLGAFGEPAFNLAIGCEFGQGKSWYVLGPNVYFSGGRDCEQDFGVIKIKFDERHGKLSYKRQMSVGRERHYILAINDNNILAIGGLNRTEDEAISKCESYNIKEDTWTNISDMPVGKYLFGAAVFQKSQVYVFSGYTSKATPSPTIECYDFTTDTWETIKMAGGPELKQRLLAAQVGENAILVFGGEGDKEKIPTYVFNPKEKTLEEVPVSATNLQTLCHDEGLPVIVHKKRVYVSSPEYLSYYIYSLQTKVWCSATIKAK